MFGGFEKMLYLCTRNQEAKNTHGKRLPDVASRT